MKYILNPYFRFLFLYSVVGCWFVLLAKSSLDIMYLNPGIDTTEYTSFFKFLSGMTFFCLIIGFFIKMKELKSPLLQFAIIMLIIILLLSIYVGYQYTYFIKSDEFLYFFLLTITATLWYFFSVGGLIRLYSRKKYVSIGPALLTVFIGVFFGFLLNTLFGLIPLFEVIYLMMLNIVVLGYLLNTVRTLEIIED